VVINADRKFVIAMDSFESQNFIQPS